MYVWVATGHVSCVYINIFNGQVDSVCLEGGAMGFLNKINMFLLLTKKCFPKRTNYKFVVYLMLNYTYVHTIILIFCFIEVVD